MTHANLIGAALAAIRNVPMQFGAPTIKKGANKAPQLARKKNYQEAGEQMELQTRLEKEARIMGAAYFGIADLSQARQAAITPYEEKLISRFPFAISIGVPLAATVVDGLGVESDNIALQNYWFHVYEAVNPLINSITLKLSQIISDEGFQAVPVPASQTVSRENLYGIFSNKMAASLAGLGWVGKNCLLITPDRGPRVRWGAILTDAPLSAGKLLQGKGCGGCNICVEACPAGAFTGKSFIPSEPRAERMDAMKCFRLMEERRKTIGVSACGHCVYVCPFGQKTK